MKELIMVVHTKTGDAQIKAVKHFEKIINTELKKIFKRWMIVKNIQIEVPTDSVGELRVTFRYDTPNSDEGIKRAVTSYKKHENI